LIGGIAADNLLTLQANSASGNTPTNAAIQMKVGDSGGTTALTILNNGNVGIGTTAPGTLIADNNAKLEVVGNILSNTANSAFGVNHPSGKFGYFTAGSSGVALGFANSGYLQIGRINSLNNSIQTVDLKIDSNGNIGIGTTSPAAGYKLDVAGFINSNQTVDQASYPSINAVQTAATLQDGSANTGADEAFDNTYEAIKFTASGAHNIRSFGVRMKVSTALTNPTSVVYGYIYSDNSGVPGSSISGSNYIRYGSLTTTYAEYQFSVSTTLTSGTSYWLVLKQSAVPAGGTIFIERGTSGTGLHAYSADGSSWTTEDNKQAWYKIYGRTSYGVYASSTNANGVYGSSINAYGVAGISTNGTGVYGSSANNYGVYGNSANFTGVYGSSANFTGVSGNSTNYYGVSGNSVNSYGGVFSIYGSLSQNNSSNTVLIRRYPSGSYNVTGNVLQITDNPTNTGTRSGALISGQIDDTERFRIDPRVVDSASAVASFIDTHNTLSTAGAKLLSIRNYGAEKAFIDYSGGGYFGGNVGIGTKSPAGKLTVRGDSSGGVVELIRLENLGTRAATGNKLSFINNITGEYRDCFWRD